MSASYLFRKISPYVAGLLLAAAIDAHAQPRPEEAVAPMRLDQAMARALENNAALNAKDFEARAAEALIEQAGLRPNPTLDVSVENFLGTGRVQGVRSLETTVQASQTFERGGKRGRRVALASREHQITAKEFALHRAELLANTAVAYVEALGAQERLTVASSPLTLARDTLAVVEARVKEGAASSAESARARAALALAESEYARAQAGHLAARAALAAAWGGRAGEVGKLPGGVRLPEVLPAEDHFIARIARHPRVELQHALIDARRASLELERAQIAQDITVGGGVRFLREGTDAAFVAGLSLPIPLRNRNQGNIRAARETLAGAEQLARAVETELRGRIGAAWQEMSAAHALAQTLRRDALPATEEAHAVVRSGYEAGQLPLIDVLDAQRALVSLRRDILDAECAYAVALARAEGLAGSDFTLTNALVSTP